MTRLWYALPPLVGAVAGVGLWLAFAIIVANWIAVVIGVVVALLVGAGLHVYVASNPMPGEAAGENPWENRTDILHQEHVPEALRFAGPDDETRELMIVGGPGCKGRRRAGVR